MDKTRRDDVRMTFRLATLRREAGAIKTGPQWQRVRAIQERCDKLRKQETRLFKERYLTRVEMQVNALMHKAGRKTLEHKPRFGGVDRFDRDALLRQARRQVAAQHHKRLMVIDHEETRGLEKEMRRAKSENLRKGHAREAFTKTVDRKAAKDRRRSMPRLRR